MSPIRQKARIAYVILLYAVVATLDVSLAAQQTQRLSGKWRLNRERSEDAKQKLEAALRQSGIDQQPANNTGPNADPRDKEREETRRRIEALIEASESLEIREDEKSVTVSEGNLRERKFYTDGRPYQREDRRGNRITVRARWRAERLVVDTRLADGGRFTESYELAPGDQQLIVIFTSADRRLKQPLVIHRVYDVVPN